MPFSLYARELEHLKRFDEFNLLMMGAAALWDDIANMQSFNGN